MSSNCSMMFCRVAALACMLAWSAAALAEEATRPAEAKPAAAEAKPSGEAKPPVTSPAKAEPTPAEVEYRLHMRDAKEAYQKGDFARAESESALAVKTAETFAPQDDRLIAALEKQSMIYTVQNKFAAAEAPARRMVEVCEKVKGADSPAVAAALNNLGAIAKSAGKLADAEAIYNRALAIVEKLPEAKGAAAMILGNLAELYRDQGKLAEAEQTVKRAIAILEKSTGPGQYYLTENLHVLGTIYTAEKKHAEALAAHQRAYDLRRKTQFWNRLVMMESLTYLADANKAAGKLAEAEPLYKQALTLGQDSIGPTDPRLLPALKGYADLLRKLKRDDEAKVYEDRAGVIGGAAAPKQ